VDWNSLIKTVITKKRITVVHSTLGIVQSDQNYCLLYFIISNKAMGKEAPLTNLYHYAEFSCRSRTNTQWLQSELLFSGSIFEIRIIFDDHWGGTLGHKYAL